MNHHQHRDVVQVYAQMPVWISPTSSGASGNRRGFGGPWTDTMTTRVAHGSRWTPVVFDRRWLQEKLAQAWEARAQDHVRSICACRCCGPNRRGRRAMPPRPRAIDTLRPPTAIARSLTRISNGGETETRWQPLMRASNPANGPLNCWRVYPVSMRKAIRWPTPTPANRSRSIDLALIEGSTILVLFAAARGEIQLEFIPATRCGSPASMPSVWRTTSRRFSNASADDLRAVAFTFGHGRKPSRGLLWCCSNKRNGPTWWPGRSGWTRDPLYTPATVPSPIYRHPPPDADRDPAAEGEPSWESATVQDLPELADGRSSWVKQPRRGVPGRLGRPPRRRQRNHPQTFGCAHRHGAAPAPAPVSPGSALHVRQPRTAPQPARPPTCEDAAVLIERPS